MSELNEASAEPRTRCVCMVVDGDPHPVRSTEEADVLGGGQRGAETPTRAASGAERGLEGAGQLKAVSGWEWP